MGKIFKMKLLFLVASAHAFGAGFGEIAEDWDCEKYNEEDKEAYMKDWKNEFNIGKEMTCEDWNDLKNDLLEKHAGTFMTIFGVLFPDGFDYDAGFIANLDKSKDSDEWDNYFYANYDLSEYSDKEEKVKLMTEIYLRKLDTRMGEFNAEQRSILSENISKIVIFLNGELETDLIAELQEWLKGQENSFDEIDEMLVTMQRSLPGLNAETKNSDSSDATAYAIASILVAVP